MDYNPGDLIQQKQSYFNVNLNSQDSIIDFMEEFNNFNTDISNRDEIFTAIGRYYSNPENKVAIVYYDNQKGHFVVNIENVVNGGKYRKTKAKRKSSKKVRKNTKRKLTKRKKSIRRK